MNSDGKGKGEKGESGLGIGRVVKMREKNGERERVRLVEMGCDY